MATYRETNAMTAIVMPIAWKLKASLMSPLTTRPMTAPMAPKNTCQVTMLTRACGVTAISGSSDSNGPPESVEKRRCNQTKKKKKTAFANCPASPPGGNHISAKLMAYTGVERTTNGIRRPQRVCVLSPQKPMRGSPTESRKVMATMMTPSVSLGISVGSPFSSAGGAKKKTSQRAEEREMTLPAMLPEAYTIRFRRGMSDAGLDTSRQVVPDAG